jgi:two-component sensor histidine kinase
VPLREFSHRTNNGFASVVAVVSIAAARFASDEAKVALADTGSVKCALINTHKWVGSE